MTTYVWYFGPVEGRNKDGLIGVVTSIHWRVVATAADGTSVTQFDHAALGDPDPNNFTPRLEAPDATDAAIQAQRRSWLGDAFITEKQAAASAAIAILRALNNAAVFSED